MDSFHFDEVSDQEEGQLLRRSHRTRQQAQKQSSVKQAKKASSVKQAKKAVAVKPTHPRTSRVAAPARKKRKSNVKSSEEHLVPKENSEARKTPLLTRTRSMLQSPSPLKGLAISPIAAAGSRQPRSFHALASISQPITIFTPAQAQVGISKRMGLVTEPVPLQDAQELSAPEASPPQTRRSSRHGSKSKPAEQKAGGSPQASSSSDTSDEYLEIYNPGLKDRIKAKQKKTQKKTKKDLAAEEARKKALLKKNQEKLEAAKAFYEEIDAEPLDQFFVIR